MRLPPRRAIIIFLKLSWDPHWYNYLFFNKMFINLYSGVQFTTRDGPTINNIARKISIDETSTELYLCTYILGTKLSEVLKLIFLYLFDQFINKIYKY